MPALACLVAFLTFPPVSAQTVRPNAQPVLGLPAVPAAGPVAAVEPTFGLNPLLGAMLPSLSLAGFSAQPGDVPAAPEVPPARAVPSIDPAEFMRFWLKVKEEVEAGRGEFRRSDGMGHHVRWYILSVETGAGLRRVIVRELEVASRIPGGRDFFERKVVFELTSGGAATADEADERGALLRGDPGRLGDQFEWWHARLLEPRSSMAAEEAWGSDARTVLPGDWRARRADLFGALHEIALGLAGPVGEAADAADFLGKLSERKALQALESPSVDAQVHGHRLFAGLGETVRSLRDPSRVAAYPSWVAELLEALRASSDEADLESRWQAAFARHAHPEVPEWVDVPTLKVAETAAAAGRSGGGRITVVLMDKDGNRVRFVRQGPSDSRVTVTFLDGAGPSPRLTVDRGNAAYFGRLLRESAARTAGSINKNLIRHLIEDVERRAGA